MIPACYSALLHLCAILVPPPVRHEWMREWMAETAVLLAHRRPALRFCLGAIFDAIEVRKFTTRHITYNPFTWSTPRACLLALLLGNAALALLFDLSPTIRANVWPRSIEIHVVIAAVSFVFANVMPGAERLWPNGKSAWVFFICKTVLVCVGVYFFSFDILPVISRPPVQPQMAFVFYIAAFRWSIRDQRHRCPICLRRLTHPVLIGNCSSTLLHWYGAEFACPKGHGLLHEPEPIASSYSSRQWVTLDATWRELFR